MHQLHLVGFAPDHDGLIFSTKKGASSGAYVVAVDDALFSALEEARRLAMAEPDDPGARAAAERVRALRPVQRSNLSVRDIQSRLRSGMTLGQVAAEAGVDEDWVARFAAPVLAEQAAVVERALGFSFTTARKGPSSRPLGEAVRWNLLDKRITVDTSPQAAGWSAFQLEPGQWAVRFTYTSRGRVQVAEWEVDLEAGELSGRNRLANELAYVEPGARRRKQVEVVVPPPPPAPKKATPGRKGTPARTTAARAQAARATSKKAAANRAKATKPAPARAAKGAERGKQGSERGKQGSERGKQGSERGNQGASGTAGTKQSAGRGGAGGSRSANLAGEARGLTSPTAGSPSPGREAARTATAVDKAPLARFPAPRPAAGRPDRAGPSGEPARPGPAPAAQVPRSDPAPRPARAAAPAAARPPAPEPALRRVAPPPRPAPAPTADARPMPTTVGRPGPPYVPGPGPDRLSKIGGPGPERPVRAEGPGPGPPSRAGGAGPEQPVRADVSASERPGGSGTEAEFPAGPVPVVRRLPRPAAAASSRRSQREAEAPVLRPVPDLPPPEPEPPPTPPRSAPPTVRPVRGGDGRPTILIIDADRAGDRRRS